MSAKTIKCTTTDGRAIEFVDEVIASGAMKDVYFSPDKSYVVCFFSREKNKFYESKAAREQQKDRLKEIVGNKWNGIFNGAGGAYWKNIFCWPDGLVEYNNLLGITAPAYKQQFFFEYGSKNNDFLKIQGKEKEGNRDVAFRRTNLQITKVLAGDQCCYYETVIGIGAKRVAG